ncbi:uncharacterized protein FOMMEDRAFT_157320 [Fomitiporia mediterranea MF3/22]|uniref:uncharacterized protein n=1 Tax=Fomitiporia mediterranea (strain MF3/22) TaxID=694068 RepID=UPI0004408771|nr:uncharacterized protein FOMMEDRAFT_157320 [Fomitiporia mediterranea MF3/22]EJD02128.1 hypothetical protein FOMMEDRAFT_157320 [Fomitiporia mediterranea MF3/22]
MAAGNGRDNHLAVCPCRHPLLSFPAFSTPTFFGKGCWLALPKIFYFTRHSQGSLSASTAADNSDGGYRSLVYFIRGCFTRRTDSHSSISLLPSFLFLFLVRSSFAPFLSTSSQRRLFDVDRRRSSLISGFTWLLANRARLAVDPTPHSLPRIISAPNPPTHLV